VVLAGGATAAADALGGTGGGAWCARFGVGIHELGVGVSTGAGEAGGLGVSGDTGGDIIDIDTAIVIDSIGIDIDIDIGSDFDIDIDMGSDIDIDSDIEFDIDIDIGVGVCSAIATAIAGSSTGECIIIPMDAVIGSVFS